MYKTIYWAFVLTCATIIAVTVLEAANAVPPPPCSVEIPTPRVC